MGLVLVRPNGNGSNYHFWVLIVNGATTGTDMTGTVVILRDDHGDGMSAFRAKFHELNGDSFERPEQRKINSGMAVYHLA